VPLVRLVDITRSTENEMDVTRTHDETDEAALQRAFSGLSAPVVMWSDGLQRRVRPRKEER
jgi:hypothetical protein